MSYNKISTWYRIIVCLDVGIKHIKDYVQKKNGHLLWEKMAYPSYLNERETHEINSQVGKGARGGGEEVR